MISPIRPWNTLFFYGRNLRCFLGRAGGEVDRSLDILSEGVVVWETGKWLRNADLNPPWECCFTQNFLSPRFFAMFSFLLKKNIFISTTTRKHALHWTKFKRSKPLNCKSYLSLQVITVFQLEYRVWYSKIVKLGYILFNLW